MVTALRNGDNAALRAHMGEMARSLGDDLRVGRAQISRNWQQAPRPIDPPRPFTVRRF
jgi:hypothetical protein